MVLGLFLNYAGLCKIREKYTEVDSRVFRLHYHFTTALLFIACALVSASEYIGGAIQCTNDGKPVDDPINTYCWISSTFTINTTGARGNIAGLGNHALEGHEERYHSYYQWVPFVLFIQGCLFYLPHLFWKASERKTADKVLQGLSCNSMDPDLEKKKENIIKYLRASRGQNNKYSIVYHFFECLNLINVVGQMFLLDDFFGGAFLKYGSKVLQFALEDTEDDPFRTTFPKVTKCIFKKYGASGTTNELHPMCILPQNILNEKVFLIMWFWFIFLATVSGIQVVRNFIVMLSPVIRVRLLEQRGKLVVDGNLGRAIQRLHLGDFFLLDIIGKNLDACTFRDIIKATLADYEAAVVKKENALYPPLPVAEEGIEAIGLNDLSH